MSNELNLNELLSAYLDGEGTREERARVEQLLDESPDARRTLDQFGELSELIRSAPDEPAPQELLPSILRRAERESLLSVGEPAAINADGRNSWLTVALGIAATAAAIAVMIQFLPDNTGVPVGTVADSNATGRMPSAERLAEHAADSPVTDTPFHDESNPLDANVSTVELEKNQPDRFAEAATGEALSMKRSRADVPKSAPVEYSKGTETKPRSAAQSLEAGRRTAAARSGAKKVASDSGASPTTPLNSEILQTARRGDVLQYFDTDGTKVTTYMVTVVDVKQALDKMQVLLARNEIPVRPAEINADKRALRRELKTVNEEESATRKAPGAGAPKAERLFAVYVETTPGRFASVLKELLDEKLFADLYPKPPVDEAQIELAESGKSYRPLFQRRTAEIKRNEFADAEKTAKAGKADDSTSRNKKTPRPSPPAVAGSAAKAKNEPLPRDRANRKPAAAPVPAKELARLGGREKQAGDKKESRRFDDLIRRQPQSFQLRVQLAPRPSGQEQLKADQVHRFAKDQVVLRPSSKTGPPSKTSLVEGKVDELTLTDAAPKSAVRVLFVFRETPKP